LGSGGKGIGSGEVFYHEDHERMIDLLIAMLLALDALHDESPSGFSDEISDGLDFVLHHLRG
jgi:hypothetical protein